MSEQVRVLIADKMDPRAAAIFRERGIEVDEKPGLSPDEFKAIIGDYDGLAVRSSTKVNAAAMDAAVPRLKVIGRAGIGVDTIDVPAATARGIVVMNTPFGNSITTAEHAIAMLFALAREIPAADQSTQAGKWEKNRFMGVELTGKTLGLIGCGNIGSIVADRAHGLKMKVVAYDPFLSPERAVELGVDKVELDELLAPRRLHLAAHAADRPDARHPVARGAGEDQAGRPHRQLRARRADRRGGAQGRRWRAATSPGPRSTCSSRSRRRRMPLFGTPNLICTPHLGASTNEAQVNVAIQVAEQMADFLLLGGITNAVNMPSLSAEEAPRLKPYMALAEKLGRLVGQIAGADIRSVAVEVEGAAAELNIKPITGAVLAGPDGHLFGHGEHGQRALLREGARARRRAKSATIARAIITRSSRSPSGRRTARSALPAPCSATAPPRLVDIFGVAVEAELTPAG